MSSEWLKDLVHKSFMQELKELVSHKISISVTDPDIEDGGSTIVKITLDQMFRLSTEVVTALQDFIEQFGKLRLGKNAPLIAKQLTIVAM